ncbi:MAG: efflux transporter outer membrane subunit [Lautropia sp.]
MRDSVRATLRASLRESACASACASARGALAVLAASLAVLAGCTTVGPDYQRPVRVLPGGFAGGAIGDDASAARDGTAASAGAAPASRGAVETDWWRRFGDARLDALVERALARNTDLQAAIARIEEADAALREAGGGLFPAVGASGSAGRGRAASPLAPGGFRVGNSASVSVSAAYEIDFWGRVRRNREAALASATASRHAADVVRLTLAGLVSQAYFNLTALDEQVALTRETVQSRLEQVRLFRVRLAGGSGSELDLNQALALRADAAVQLRELQRQRAVSQNQLARLVGDPGLVVLRARDADPLSRLSVPPRPPVGLPSDTLLRRPDVRQAEENLIAANARIGVARAAMLPSISLTGALGQQSTELSTLLDAGNRIWSLGFGLAVPIFNAGTLAAREAQAQARYAQLVASYQGAIEAGFQDVSNALVSVTASQVAEADVRERARATRRAVELATARYDAGYTGYLELLDAQRSNFAAEIEVVRNRLARLNASVDLFRAIAGGWPDAAPATAAGSASAPGGAPGAASSR